MKVTRPLRWLGALGGYSRGVLGINQRNRQLIDAENPRALRYLVDDKVHAKKLLLASGALVPETLGVARALIEIPRTLASLEGRNGFVIKPAYGAAGRGVLVVRAASDDGGWVMADGAGLTRRDVVQHIAETIFGAFSRRQEDAALVEELVHPHPFFAELSQHGLSDVRLLVYRGTPIMAMIRAPVRGSRGRANLHAGGLGLGVDIEHGSIISCVRQRRRHTSHPESGKTLLGLRVPNWDSIIEAGVLAARAFPLGYLGVDVVLDRAGRALVLEVNARAGLEIQNVCGRGLLTALRGAAGEDAWTE